MFEPLLNDWVTFITDDDIINCLAVKSPVRVRLLKVGESVVASPNTPLCADPDIMFVPDKCESVCVEDDTVPDDIDAAERFVNCEPSPLK